MDQRECKIPKWLLHEVRIEWLLICVVDVDVPEPDEKSVITYISSLYDVFPDVPSVEETLRDNVRLGRKFSH